MKIILATLFLLLFTAFNMPAQIPYATKIDTAACNKRKADKIKTVYTLRESYDTVKGILPKKARVDTVTFSRYDENGRTTEFCISPGDKSQHHTWYFYDSEGRLVRRLSCHPDSSNGFVEKYEYNNDGQVARSTIYSRTENKDEILNVALFFYDGNGLLISEEVYRDSSRVAAKQYDKRKIFFYDAKQRETQMFMFSSGGDTMYIDSTVYPSHGHKIQRGYLVQPMMIGDYKVNQRRMISSSVIARDTLEDRIIMEFEFIYFAGKDHVNEIRSRDSTITSLTGQLLYDYSNDQSTQYFYSKSGEFDYAIIYNRNNKPVQRERKHIIYYK